MRVYFTNKEPNDEYGRGPQMDDLNAPVSTPLTDYD